VNVEDGESTLMIMRDEKNTYPLSTYAFTVSQSSKRKLNQNVGALIVYRNGSVKRIKGIERLGFYGSKISEKVSSALWGVHSIKTQLEDVEISFPELRKLIIEVIELDSQGEDPSFEIADIEQTIAAISTADNTAEILDLIELPTPEDCLDVL